jgi:hypothetical protein
VGRLVQGADRSMEHAAHIQALLADLKAKAAESSETEE